MPKVSIYNKAGISVEIDKLQIIYKNKNTRITKIYGLVVTGNGISFRKEIESKEIF